MTPINYDKYKGHTKGPFIVDNGAKVYSDDATGSIVAKCDGFEWIVRPEKEYLANAHLFADSPLILQRCMELEELLKLRYELEGVLSDYEHDKSFGDIGYNTIKRVAQALARAEEGNSNE